MKIFQSLSLLLIFTLVLSACGGIGKRITGEGPLITDTRMLTEIDEIVLDNAVRLELTQGETQSVQVHAQANVQPYLKTTLKGKTLTISAEGNLSMSEDTYITITLKNLKMLTCTSSANITAANFRGDKLELNSSGSGEISLTDVGYDQLDLKKSGSGDLNLTGRADKVDVQNNSGGAINAASLKTKKAKIENKGSGSISIAVSDQLEAKISGSGDISYTGNPKVELEDTGSGELNGSN